MSDSPKVIAISIGIASTRAIYFEGDKTFTASAPATWPDLSIGLSEVTKKISKAVGHSISPDKSIITGTQTTLESLPMDLKADLIPENDATSALEKNLSLSLHRPTAILDLGASAFLDHYPAEEVGRWLTFATNLTDLENYLANHKLFPAALPVTPHEYEIDLAVARQAIIKLGERGGSDFLELTQRINLVITGGLAAGSRNQVDLTSLVLDAFYFPDGVTVLVDEQDNLPILGAILVDGGEVDVNMGLRTIGSFLHLGGTHKLTIDVGSQRLLLLSGEIVVLPAGAEDTVEVTVMAGNSARKFNLSGGQGGIYLDNRPRPLGLAPSSRESAAKILAWRKSLTGVQLFEGEK